MYVIQQFQDIIWDKREKKFVNSGININEMLGDVYRYQIGGYYGAFGDTGFRLEYYTLSDAKTVAEIMHKENTNRAIRIVEVIEYR